MNEETTRKFDRQSFEERVLAEFAALNQRLTVLEEKVDARLRETRPIWEGMKVQLHSIEETLEDINLQLGEVVRDLFKTRGHIARLEDRERPPAA